MWRLKACFTMPGNNFIYLYKIFLSYLIIILLNLPSTEPFSPPQSSSHIQCVCVCVCNPLSVIRQAVMVKITLVTLAKKTSNHFFSMFLQGGMEPQEPVPMYNGMLTVSMSATKLCSTALLLIFWLLDCFCPLWQNVF